MMVRGIVIGSKIQLNDQRSFIFDGGISREDIVRWLLYWDKIAYAGVNGFSAVHPEDFQILKDEGVFFTKKVLVDPIKLGLPPPEPGFNIAGFSVNHMPYCLSAARVELSNQLSSCDEIWAVGQSGGEQLILPPGQSKIDMIDIQLFNKMPIPLSDVPFAELLEFRSRYRDELIRLRFYLDKLREKILRSDDDKRSLDAVFYEIAKSLEDIDNAMTGKGIKHVKETLSLYINNPAIGFWTCLGGISTAALGVPVELAGAASLAIPTMFKCVSRCIEVNNHAPDFNNDFAYAFQVKSKLV
ncbi:DUF6236 family protein [Aeromonas media]|uniref:DUF6236 family protein n=1 Tax=Aeromonas media TaxID=651 RepID=A0AAP6L3P4_AERME|nr:DUF6236 family protein [Aeromonas media]MDX7924087.1 DUF6236 family protein [Aeromonas media]